MLKIKPDKKKAHKKNLCKETLRKVKVRKKNKLKKAKFQIKLRKIGNSTGAIFPKEIISLLHVEEGDTLMITGTPDGIQLTPYDADFEAAMTAFEQTRRKYRNTLRKLAK